MVDSNPIVLFEVDRPGELGVVTFISEHTVSVLLVEVRLDGVWTRRVAHPLLCKYRKMNKSINQRISMPDKGLSITHLAVLTNSQDTDRFE